MNGGGILDLFTFMAILAFFSYISRELEIRRLANEIELYLTLFKAARDSAVVAAVRRFGELVAKTGERVNISDLENKVRSLTETVEIFPVSMDSFGLVRKVKHILRSEDSSIKSEIKRLTPLADKGEIEVVADLVNVARGLNFIYKYINHNYALAKRFKSYWLLLQLNALLPFVAEEVRAYESAVEALVKQVPIGDSAGPLVLTTLAKELKAKPVNLGVPDTYAYLAEYDGRNVIMIKAEGPGSSVGRLDEAVRRVITLWGGSLALVITVDAMVKLEGEVTGEIAEGYGVAIGGVGVERFSIEEVLTEYGLKPYAVLVKMSAEEALLPISKELYSACLLAKDRVKDAIVKFVQPGAAALIIGVGNTLGVGN